MKRILSIIALFSCSVLAAQEYTPSFGRELPRGRTVPYPSQAEAAVRDDADHRYRKQLKEWTREGNVFAAEFTVPFAWANRQVLFRLAEASADYEVRINGQIVGRNADGCMPADFNITRAVDEGRNRIEIAVSEPSALRPLESWKGSTVPAIGVAEVVSPPTMYIRDLFARTWRSGVDSMATAEVAVVVRTGALNPRTSRIYYELLDSTGRRAAVGHKDLTLDMRREDTLRFLARIPDSMLWSPANPHRYTLRLKTRHEGRDVEFHEYPLGLRTIDVRSGKLYMNDVPVALHVREVPAAIAPEEVAALRREGYTALRLLPGPVSEELLEYCDSTGMLLVAQAPIDTSAGGLSRRKGGNPSNDPAWKEAFIERALDSYHAVRRHPSVVAFALARKSANGICLYESYRALKSLGDDRPVIYPDAEGEWNNDRLHLDYAPASPGGLP